MGGMAKHKDEVNLCSAVRKASVIHNTFYLFALCALVCTFEESTFIPSRYSHVHNNKRLAFFSYSFATHTPDNYKSEHSPRET